jgi:hypothetical protein
MPRAQMDKSAVAAVVPTPSRATLGSARSPTPQSPELGVFEPRSEISSAAGFLSTKVSTTK